MTPLRYPIAAAVLAALLVALWPASARAEGLRVAVLLPPARRSEVARALRVELAGRQARVVAGEAPRGRTLVERAADAQREARLLDADVAVWSEIDPEGEELHAVLTEGDAWARAPLPGPLAVIDARVVGTIAASLVDEAAAGLAFEPEAEPTPEPERPALDAAPAERPAPEPPAITVSFTPIARRAAPPRDEPHARAAVGLGVLGPSLGLSARLSRPLGHHVALGVVGSVGIVMRNDGHTLGTLALDLSFAATRRLELGVFAGIMYQGEHTSEDDPTYEYTSGLDLGPAGARLTLRFPLAPDTHVLLDSTVSVAGPFTGTRLLGGGAIMFERLL